MGPHRRARGAATAAAVVVAVATASMMGACIAVPEYHRVRELPGLASAPTGHFSGYLNVPLAGIAGAAAPTSSDMFYYYVQHPDPAKPLLVWMNGGPGSSSLIGLFTELGPLLLNNRSRPVAGGPWTLHENPHAFSTEASLLVWEQPAGVGFSHCVAAPPTADGPSPVGKDGGGDGDGVGDGDATCPSWDDESSAEANLRLLLAFYDAFPSERARPLVISGESYAGVYVPLLARQVHQYNSNRATQGSNVRPTHHAGGGGGGGGYSRDADADNGDADADSNDRHDAGQLATIPLQGIVVGNGCVGFDAPGGCGRDVLRVLLTVLDQGAPGVDRALTAAAFSTCGAELDIDVQSADQLTPKCRQAIAAVLADIGEYNEYSWGSPCGPDGSGNWGSGDGFTCGAYDALNDWVAELATQKALHVVPENSTASKPWASWDGDNATLYNISMATVLPVYAELMDLNYSVTIYNGLRDTGVPAVGAELWIPTVAGPVSVPRRKWTTGGAEANTTVAGYVTEYARGLRFVTVIGAGHFVPAERPQSALEIVAAALSADNRPLPEYTGIKCKRLFLGRGYGDFC